jgi:hypothetical protein
MADATGTMTADVRQLTMEELNAGLDEIRKSPKDEGVLHLIVRRPQGEQREILQEGELDFANGLVGDNWKFRGSKLTADGSSHPDVQLTVMNSRVANLVAQNKDRWQLAGDQLFVDIDLSDENLPAGSQLAIGSAVIEVSAIPHTGCKKFVARYGMDAMEFVNSPIGKQLHLRGINARVIQPGTIRVGDIAKKL